MRWGRCECFRRIMWSLWPLFCAKIIIISMAGCGEENGKNEVSKRDDAHNYFCFCDFRKKKIPLQMVYFKTIFQLSTFSTYGFHSPFFRENLPVFCFNCSTLLSKWFYPSEIPYFFLFGCLLLVMPTTCLIWVKKKVIRDVIFPLYHCWAPCFLFFILFSSFIVFNMSSFGEML